jgi:hypothetical protein
MKKVPPGEAAHFFSALFGARVVPKNSRRLAEKIMRP